MNLLSENNMYKNYAGKSFLGAKPLMNNVKFSQKHCQGFCNSEQVFFRCNRLVDNKTVVTCSEKQTITDFDVKNIFYRIKLENKKLNSRNFTF